jgi:hypothetical protein|tara:strand:+ start:511 stop:795 length:285 start_codon:yes stop_codon:yes gene_type:complete
MSDEEQGIWNGGKTRINKEEAKVFRQMEDSYDITDSERETREELVERQKVMDETRIERKPMHELYTSIDYSEKTKVSGIGGLGGPIDTIRGKEK